MSGELILNFNDMESILKALAQHFGSDCEFVYHDFSNGYDNSVAAIENGHVTGRSVGSSITNSGLESLALNPSELGNGIYNYFSTATDGRLFRSSSAVIRNKDGSVRGSLCINQDITKLRAAEDALRALTHSDNYSELKGEVFVQNVDQLLDHYIFECSNMIGRPPAKMNKDELKRSITFLEEKGVFKITKSGDHVCSTFGITKYQLYRQLDEIRGGKKQED